MKDKIERIFVYVAGFSFSFAIALISYINSSYLKSYLGEKDLGFVYIFASLITIFCLLKTPKILSILGNRQTSIVFSFIVFLSLINLYISNSAISSVIFFITYFASVSLVYTSLDIFLEKFTQNKNVGKFRGLYLTIINLAWILAQLIFGFLLNKNGNNNIYLISAICVLIPNFIFLFLLKNFKDPEYKNVSIIKTFKVFRKNTNLNKIYFINLILQFFYVWMVIYMPIYLESHIGFGWDKIGIMFSIMLLPFLFEFPMGKFSDKIGEKKMLILGFLIISISVFLIPFIKKPDFILWTLVLFSTRIGASFIEIMSESYFFKMVNEKEANEISFFRNTPSTAYLVAPLIAFPILIYSPSFEYLFIILGTITLSGIIFSYRIKDIK